MLLEVSSRGHQYNLNIQLFASSRTIYSKRFLRRQNILTCSVTAPLCMRSPCDYVEFFFRRGKRNELPITIVRPHMIRDIHTYIDVHIRMPPSLSLSFLCTRLTSPPPPPSPPRSRNGLPCLLSRQKIDMCLMYIRQNSKVQHKHSKMVLTVWNPFPCMILKKPNYFPCYIPTTSYREEI